MNSALEGVSKVTFHILDLDVMRFRRDPLVGIGILDFTIKFQTLNRSWAVKWLMVVQQPILKKMHILSMSTFPSYLSASRLTSSAQSSYA